MANAQVSPTPDDDAPPEATAPTVKTPGFRAPRTRRPDPAPEVVETPTAPPVPTPKDGRPLAAGDGPESAAGGGPASLLRKRRVRSSSRASTDPRRPVDAATLGKVRRRLAETVRFSLAGGAGLANRAHRARVKAPSEKWIPTRTELDLVGGAATGLIERRLELSENALDAVDALSITTGLALYGFRNITGVDLAPEDEELAEKAAADRGPAWRPPPPQAGPREDPGATAPPTPEDVPANG